MSIWVPHELFPELLGSLENDVMKAVNQLHERHEFERSPNATYVAVIRKKLGAAELRDIRPVILMGGIYKVFDKLLDEKGNKQA